MKKFYVLALLCLIVLPVSAQYMHQTWVKPWQGPKRLFAGVGYQFVIGEPTFMAEGIGFVKPQQFKNYGSAVGSFGIDMVGNEDGFGIGGCFFYMDIYRDGWDATFEGGPTYGSAYAPYTYNYTMSGLSLCGAAGLNMNYTIAEKLQILLGVGIYVGGMTKIKISSAITDDAGKDYGEDPVNYFANYASGSNVNIGLTTHLQVNYYIGEHFFVGLSGRVDAWPFYNSFASNDYANMYCIGDIMYAACDHRRRIQTMVTFGYLWD